ncbi:MAG: hypothetical protein ACJATF_003733 [Flavobacteriales bacterium]
MKNSQLVAKEVGVFFLLDDRRDGFIFINLRHRLLKTLKIKPPMEKYLSQLLADLQAAHRSEEDWDKESEEPQTIEKHFEEVEAFLNWEEERPVGPTFGEVCGIDKAAFPPITKLQPKQIKTLGKAIDELFWTWNISLDLPDTLPEEQVYSFQVEVFDTKVMIVEFGTVNISLCENDFNLCVFGEDHCDCKKQWDEMEEEERIYDEKVQLFIQELSTKLSSAAAKIKFSIADEDMEILGTKLLPIQTLADWFGISMEDFPDTFPLWEKRANHISEIIMQLWDPEDEMIPILKSIEWEKRFTALKNYMENKVWFDGIDTLHFLPIPEEEIAQYKSPLDFLDLENLGNPENLENEGDDDLPF